MENSGNIQVKINEKLAVITLCNPKNKNAINSVMYENITKALEEISRNDEVAITVITGSGEYYSSGTDLKSGINFDPDSINMVIKQQIQRVRKFIEAFINHSKILVAVVNGPAIGIAVTTLPLCDIVYCKDTATFATPFTKLGLVAEGCSSYTFPLIMGTAKANNMLLFGHKLTAAEANESGLVSKVYTEEEINNILWPQLKKNAAEFPTKSLIHSKQMIRKFHQPYLYDANKQECERLEERLKSEDFTNAVLNFLSSKSKL